MPCPFSLYYLRKYTGRNALFTYCGQLNKDSLIHFLLLQGMFLLVRKIGKSCDQSSKKLLKKYPRQFTLDPRKYTLDILPSTLNKNLHSKSAYFLKLTDQESWRSNGFLKGQSQLIHVRIRYHFLADLHVTGHARETWSEDTQNKPCRVELVTSRNHDYRVQTIPEHSFFYIPLNIHRWICPGKAKHRLILLNSIISRILFLTEYDKIMW